MAVTDINITSPSTEFGPLRVLGAFVHLSDIHAAHGDAAWRIDQEMVLAELIKDLTRLTNDGLPPIDAILLSGDLGVRGGSDPTEYQRVRAFADRLKKAARLRKRGVVLAVPGNHDVIRTPRSDRKTFRLIDDLREGRRSLDESIRRSSDAAALAQRFVKYVALVRRLMPRVRGKNLLAWSRDIRLAGGLTVEIIGLNTALLCNDDHDRHKLRLGAHQIKVLQGEGNSNRLRIAMMHHPTSWLEKEDGVEFTAWLSRYAQIHLYGHIHAANAASARSATGDELLTLVAGATHGERKRRQISVRHGYSVVVLCAAGEGRVIARVLPRVFFRRKEFVTDYDSTKDGQIFAEFPLKFFVKGERRTSENSWQFQVSSAGSYLSALAGKLIERTGRRRTAFPTDLSVRELAEQDLLVPTPLVNRSRRGSAAKESVADLLKCIDRNENTLVLGSPGGGKTVLSYEAALAISRKTAAVPLVLDLRAAGVKSIVRDSLDGLVRQLIRDFGGYAARRAVRPPKTIIIIDGLDERLAAGETAEEISDLLVALSRLAPILVTCRAEDYERMLAAIVPGELFDQIFDIQPWSLKGEFRDFIARLARHSLVDAPSIMTMIGNDAQLIALIERPLFARMLTYVIGDVGGPPRSRTALYQVYLTKLGKTTDALLMRGPCRSAVPAIDRWRAVAATIFAEHDGGADEMPVARLMACLGKAGVSANCAYRLLAAIMDIETIRGRLSAAFIHYSFFEFLVAEHLALELTKLFPNEATEAVSLLVQHIPQEIRRHLVRILAEIIPEQRPWLDWLVRLYETARAFPDAKRRTAANMVAYLACRLQLDAAPRLRELLRQETDPFLINSISWAMARLDDTDETWSWLKRLNRDEALASLNRGYLLYYLGDLKQSAPPYRDDSPYIDCKHTRKKLFDKLKESAGTRAAARRAVDLFSFLDLLSTRGLKLNVNEALTTRKFIAQLKQDLSPATYRILLEKIAITT